MKGYAGDRVFWVAIAILTFFHVDFWAWNKIHPMLFGWIPYHLWYDGLLTIAGASFFLWWSLKKWPEPPKDWLGGEE